MNQPEEHYVLFLAKRSRPGLTVMTEVAYDELRELQPKFQYTLVGNFFSRVTLDGLAKAVADALTIPEEQGGEGIDTQPPLIVDRQEECIEMKDYVIREENGARVYVAPVHGADAKKDQFDFVYEMVGYRILDCLIAPNDSRGTAGQLCNKIRKDMSEVLDMVEQMRQITRETGESLEGLRKELEVLNAHLEVIVTEIEYGKPNTRYVN